MRTILPRPLPRGLARTLVAISALYATVASSQPVGPEMLSRCRALSDNRARLTCFDELAVRSKTATGAASSQPPAVTYTAVSLLDFKTDRETMIGQTVVLGGELGLLGQLGALRGPGDLLNPVWVSTDRLSAEARRDLQARCARPCQATVYGKVVHVFDGVGVAAETVQIDSR